MISAPSATAPARPRAPAFTKFHSTFTPKGTFETTLTPEIGGATENPGIGAKEPPLC
jgi:hypothetical protein